MCGIIAVSIKNVTKEDMKLISYLLLQSQIRGKHATGISWYDGAKLNSIIEPVSVDIFLKRNDINSIISEEGNIYLIGHCRYSTSDLKYNQPIIDKDLAVVHNGVISQDSPENWKQKYNLDCITKNDSELILRSFQDKKHPLEAFPDSSMSVCMMKNSYIQFFRNGLRPLYYSEFDRGVFVASTKDIMLRSKIPGTINYTIMNQIYYIEDFKVHLGDYIKTNKQDLQNV